MPAALRRATGRSPRVARPGRPCAHGRGHWPEVRSWSEPDTPWWRDDV